MRPFRSPAVAAALAAAATACLGPDTLAQTGPGARAGVSVDAAFTEITSRYHTEFAYVLPSSLSFEGTTFGDVDTTEAQVSYQVSVPVSECLALLAGFELRGTWFDVPGAAPIPDALYETSARLGANWRMSDTWRLQVLLSPGLYSDFQDIDSGDLAVPGLILAFWDVSPRLQLIGGASINLRRDLPVIPAIGGRWQFADDWTLLAVFPTPRIEYAASRAVTVFAGAEIIRTAYRVAKNFGDAYGRPELNDEDLSYNEWRVGAGVRWRLAPALTVAFDGGWMGDREFNFDERDFALDSEGAPYFQISVGGTF